MKIFYNLDCIRAPMTGVAYHTQNMVLAMIKNFPDLDIIACRHNTLLSKEQILELLSGINNAPTKSPAWKALLVEIINRFSFARSVIQWRRNRQHRLTLKHMVQGYIYHEPNFVFLPHDGPKVMTLHDISMFSCPEFLPKGRAHFLRQQMHHGMHAADAMIVSCQFIKDQTIEILGISEKKIHVTPPGAQANFKPRTSIEVQPCLQKFSLQYRQFLLCVATLEPRKNLLRLIQAYQALPDYLQKKYPLVLVGSKGWLYEELLKAINKNKHTNILLLRYVDEDALFQLYSAAKAFVYPSLYEGFGLPVLEAMQSGLPVITSNVSSLPEVCGNAGILVDPLDESAITAAIHMLLTADEATYFNFVQQSLAQAKKFSWDYFSAQLFATYQHISPHSDGA